MTEIELPETDTMNAMELVRRAFERYKHLHEIELKAIRDWIKERLPRSSSTERVQLVPRMVVADILLEMQKEGKKYDLAGCVTGDTPLYVGHVAKALASNPEADATEIFQAAARRHGSIQWNSLKKHFARYGFAGEGRDRSSGEVMEDLRTFTRLAQRAIDLASG